jgi:hypothetical protein
MLQLVDELICPRAVCSTEAGSDPGGGQGLREVSEWHGWFVRARLRSADAPRARISLAILSLYQRNLRDPVRM